VKVEFFVTGTDQDCGIAAYTSSLEDTLEVDHARTPLKLRSTNVVHYVRQALRAGMTDADVIHVQHEYDIYGPKSLASWFVFPLLWILSRLRNRPLVVTYHNAWTEGTIDPPLSRLKWLYLVCNNRLLAAVTDHAIFLSAETREGFERTASFPSVEVLAHGVPTDTREMDPTEAKRRLGVDPEKPLVVEPGFVRPQKGYHEFLDIAERVEDVTFLIGGGTHEDNYEEYMAQLRERCSDEVDITGVLDDEEFHTLFNAMDLALLPYGEVSQSGILNWCLAYGVPVVATDLREFVNLSEEYGFPVVYPAGDADVGAGAVEDVLSDPEPVVERMTAYREQFSMDAIADAHREIYRAVLDTDRTGTDASTGETP